jgi:hypothetical protein
MLSSGSLQEAVAESKGNTSTLRMTLADADPAITPSRLYQLFAGAGGGGVVWTPEAAEMLQEAQGWTAQPVLLTPEEASYLTAYAGRQVRAGQTAFFVRCDGYTQVVGNRVLCGSPAQTEASRLPISDLTSAQKAPVLQYLSDRQIPSAIVLTPTAGLSVDGLESSVINGAGDAMRLYREIEEFYRAYVKCADVLGRDFAPSLEETNLVLKVRDTLARFAQPVQTLRVSEGAGNTELEPARLSIEGAMSFVGGIFISAVVTVAFILLNAALPEIKGVKKLLERLKKLACRRAQMVLQSPNSLSSTEAQHMVCLAAFDCERPPLPAWVKVAAGAGAVFGILLMTQRR